MDGPPEAAEGREKASGTRQARNERTGVQEGVKKTTSPFTLLKMPLTSEPPVAQSTRVSQAHHAGKVCFFLRVRNRTRAPRSNSAHNLPPRAAHQYFKLRQFIKIGVRQRFPPSTTAPSSRSHILQRNLQIESKKKTLPQLNGLWYNDYLRSADTGSILSAAKRCMTERHFKGSASDS